MDANASETTLVDPSTTCISSGSDIVFTLSHDDMTNTALYSSSDAMGKPTYTLVSEEGDRSKVTRLLNAHGEEIAILKSHACSRDELIFPANPKTGDKAMTTRLDSWMRRGFFRNSTRSFRDKQKRKYKWQGHAPYSDLVLRAKDYPDGAIAHFKGSKRTSSSLVTDVVPATLTLSPRAQEIQDTAIISCLFLEQRRRMNLAKTVNAWHDIQGLRGDDSSAAWGRLLVTLF